MLNNETIWCVAKELIGSIDPVGETNTDDERFANLKVSISVIEELIKGIAHVAINHDRCEHSMSRAGKHAKEFLYLLSEELSCYGDLKNDN